MLRRRFSRLELATLGLILSIVVYAMLSRVLLYFEIAEKAAMTVTVLNLQRGLAVRMLLGTDSRGGTPDERVLAANPFEFAQAVPPNYLGEFDAPETLGERTLQRGNWLYDRGRREIVYLPRLSSRLVGAANPAAPMLRFRVELGAGKARIPRVVPILPYRWEPDFAMRGRVVGLEFFSNA